jgi:hypothetical protein
MQAIIKSLIELIIENNVFHTLNEIQLRDAI